MLDGQTPEQLDRVIDRWQRMLSGLDSRSRFYFYLLRRGIRFDEDAPGADSVAELGRRKRNEFLTGRVQEVSAYVAWAHDPQLALVTGQQATGPWWMAYVKNWMSRGRTSTSSVYLRSRNRDGGGDFGRASRQAGRWSMTSRRYGCSERRRPAVF